MRYLRCRDLTDARRCSRGFACTARCALAAQADPVSARGHRWDDGNTRPRWNAAVHWLMTAGTPEHLSPQPAAADETSAVRLTAFPIPAHALRAVVCAALDTSPVPPA